MNVLAGGPNVTVSRVIGKSKEKIGKSSGGRAKGGRSRQFCESLASQRRRLVNILAGVPRVADRHSFASHWRVKGDLRMFWRECQGWQIRESLASQRRRLANVLARGPRLTEQDSLEVFGMVHHRDRHNPPSQAHLGLFGGEKKSQNKNFDNHNITTI